jgi:hypothetical protein
MTKPYYYVRFRWDMGVDIGKVAGELAEGFNVEEVKTFESDRDMTLYKGHREELKATADSLTVLLSRTRAVLYQREAEPFTEKDMALRGRILELYPRGRVTPLPLLFSDEPKFEVADSSRDST